MTSNSFDHEAEFIWRGEQYHVAGSSLRRDNYDSISIHRAHDWHLMFSTGLQMTRPRALCAAAERALVIARTKGEAE